MKKILLLLLSFTFCLLVQAKDTTAGNVITQVSSYNGLFAKLYDGTMTYDELLPYGDFGLGTFDRVDGEMILLDGVLYQADVKGNINVMESTNVTPYCTIIQFDPEQTFKVKEGLSFNELKDLIASKFKNNNCPQAVKVHGTFSYIKCRSVPQQQEPFAPLSKLAENQVIFIEKEIKGTLVGFYYPEYLRALNPPGYHVHFVSDDKSFGGHILDLTTGNATAMIDQAGGIQALIPDTPESRKANLSKDRSADVKKVVGAPERE